MMMKMQEIIKLIKKRWNENKKEFRRIRAIASKEKNKYIVSVMASYSGGEGLGFCGSMCIIEISYNSRLAADKMKDEINKLRLGV